MSNGGYFKLWRKFVDNPWLRDPEFLALWIHLLSLATHRNYDVIWSGRRIRLKPGQFITSRAKLAEKSGVESSKVERILKVFKSEQQIEQRTSSLSRLITIVNWDAYQQSEQQSEQRVNSERTASEQRVNTNKNINTKELKKQKNNNIRGDYLKEAKSSTEPLAKIISNLSFKEENKSNLDEIFSNDDLYLFIQKNIAQDWIRADFLRVARKYGLDRLKVHIRAFMKEKKVSNPAGWIKDSLKNNYSIE